MTKSALILEHKTINHNIKQHTKGSEFFYTNHWHCCDLCIIKKIMLRFKFEAPSDSVRKYIANNINILLYPSCKVLDVTSYEDLDNDILRFSIIGKNTYDLIINSS